SPRGLNRMSGPTQPVTLNEEWSDERVKSWLDVRPYDDAPLDYYVLQKAYEAMLPEHFERFIRFFVEAGRDINMRNRNGETFLDRVSRHAQSSAFVDILRHAGGR